jgi:hypothetical protein
MAGPLDNSPKQKEKGRITGTPLPLPDRAHAAD